MKIIYDLGWGSFLSDLFINFEVWVIKSLIKLVNKKGIFMMRFNGRL